MASLLATLSMGQLEAGSGDGGCVASATNVCVTLDPYSSETGYYNFAGYTGSSPDITVNIGDSITFDQSDSSNWYHPIGFAYEPDGAHGSTWGGAELPEVEGKGELQYYIDGKAPACADAGDTGLDCYEPEFFFPRGEWAAKKYTATLTITQAVADASNGGVIYYFCHIHSKMSGKIKIAGSTGKAGSKEISLYSPVTRASFDDTCGTTGVDKFSPSGSNKCSMTYIGGTVSTGYEKCFQAIDCAMNSNMRVLGYDTHKSEIATFVQQMIPHHQNAVNMAKILMKSVSAADITAAMDEDGLTDILWAIINEQNFQVHQFRNYLGGSAEKTVSDTLSKGLACDTTLADTPTIPGTGYSNAAGRAVTGCTPSATNICMTLDPFAGESGYYYFAGHTGASPTIEVNIGDTIVFDQSDSSNWYHPVGFAYEPDGAHGSTWGGAELPEVEGKGELQYYIDGKAPTCADAGDTGLDCYEPEFFFPRGDWSAKKYTAKLTITQAVADASNGGVIYYFCHIHSKMSGKIKIAGSTGKAGSKEKALYLPSKISPEDNTCGTYNVGVYGHGQPKACAERFLCGKLDTTFEACLQAVDCAMYKEMKAEVTADGADKIAYFMQQMIPHHQNAVNMAKIVMKTSTAEKITAAMDEDGLTDILWNIINVQNFQIHQFRNYLAGKSLLKEDDIADNATEWRPALGLGAIIGVAVGGLVGVGILGFIVKKFVFTGAKAAAQTSASPAKAV